MSLWAWLHAFHQIRLLMETSFSGASFLPRTGHDIGQECFQQWLFADLRCIRLLHQAWEHLSARCLNRAVLRSPNISRKFPSFSWNDFLAVDTQTAVLVSTAKVRISAPDPNVILFRLLGMDRCFDFPADRRTLPRAPVTKTRVSAPAPCKKTPSALICVVCLDVE